MKIRVIAFTANGCRTARRIAAVLTGEEVALYAKSSGDETGLAHVEGLLADWTAAAFAAADAVVFVGAVGIAVRMIAPCIRTKDVDPAVVDVDEHGRFAVPLLAGHIGGANALAERLAAGLGAIPVVTTATDINGKISIDAFAVTHGLAIGSLAAAKDVAARVLDGRPVGFASDFPVVGAVPSELGGGPAAPVGVYVGERGPDPFPETLRLTPRRLVLGLGCRRGMPEADIAAAAGAALAAHGFTESSVRAVASIDLKQDEPGLLAYAARLGVPALFFSADELNALPDAGFSRSAFVTSVTGVDCVCERAAVRAARDGHLTIRKTAGGGVTVAAALEEYTVDFRGVV